MWNNFKKNRFMAIAGLETMALGFYLLLIKNVFADEIDHMARFLSHTQDPIIDVLLVIIGMVAFSVATFDFKKHHAKRFAMSLMIGVWSSYLVVFAWHDFNAPGIPLHLSTLLIIFLIINAVAELLGGDDR